MKGKNFETTQEIYQHLLSGGVITRDSTLVKIVDGGTYRCDDGSWIKDYWFFRDPEAWSIYEEPKKMKKIKLFRYTIQYNDGGIYQTEWTSFPYATANKVIKTEEKEIEVEDV